MSKLFAVSQLGEFSGVGAIAFRCSLAFTAGPAEQEQCEKSAAEAFRLFDHLPGVASKDGRAPLFLTFREAEQRRLAQQIARGCSAGRWEGFAPAGRGSPTPFEAYLNFAAAGAPELGALPQGLNRDRALVDYADRRLLLIDNGLHFFGEDKVAAFQGELDRESHHVALRALEQRLADPAFAEGLPTIDRANYTLLVRQPLTLKTCWSKRASRGSRNG